VELFEAAQNIFKKKRGKKAEDKKEKRWRRSFFKGTGGRGELPASKTARKTHVYYMERGIRRRIEGGNRREERPS